MKIHRITTLRLSTFQSNEQACSRLFTTRIPVGYHEAKHTLGVHVRHPVFTGAYSTHLPYLHHLKTMNPYITSTTATNLLQAVNTTLLLELFDLLSTGHHPFRFNGSAAEFNFCCCIAFDKGREDKLRETGRRSRVTYMGTAALRVQIRATCCFTDAPNGQ